MTGLHPAIHRDHRIDARRPKPTAGRITVRDSVANKALRAVMNGIKSNEAREARQVRETREAIAHETQGLTIASPELLKLSAEITGPSPSVLFTDQTGTALLIVDHSSTLPYLITVNGPLPDTSKNSLAPGFDIKAFVTLARDLVAARTAFEAKLKQKGGTITQDNSLLRTVHYNNAHDAMGTIPREIAAYRQSMESMDHYTPWPKKPDGLEMHTVEPAKSDGSAPVKPKPEHQSQLHDAGRVLLGLNFTPNATHAGPAPVPRAVTSQRTIV